MIDTSTYINRRDRLKKQVGFGIIMLLGNDESSINFADNWYPFRQDSSFLYFTGLKKPHLLLIIDIDENEEILFGTDPDIDDIIWTGKVPSLKEWADRAGIPKIREFKDLPHYLSGIINSRTIHYLPSYRPEHVLKLQKWLGWKPHHIKQNVSKDLIRAVVQQRNIKTDNELAEIEEAVTITAEMHLEAMRVTRPGMKEYEIMSRVNQKALEYGGQLSFPIILTKHGEILHNHSYHHTVREGDMILCDAGAENNSGYAGDLTRTFPVGEQFTETQRRFYNIVLEAQKASVDKLKPGILFKEVHLAACRTLVEGLKDIGLMKGNSEDAVAEGAHTLFFQCGLGHLMGLDVHDMESLGEEYVGYSDEIQKSNVFGLKSLRLGRPLQEGFVLTVEPGIYIIPDLIELRQKENKYDAFVNYDLLEEYLNFGGVRVEDDYVITKDGARLLGPPLPRTADEIEEVRMQAISA